MDDDDDADDNDNNDDERSEVSSEFNFGADIMSSITSTLYPVENRYIDKSFIFNDEVFLNIESTATTDQTSKKRNIQFSCDPKTTIDGYTLSRPRYGINDYFFEGN